MVLKATLATAASMGDRAGKAWKTSGIPSPNPFPDSAADLAQAWRAAYLKAACCG